MRKGPKSDGNGDILRCKLLIQVRWSTTTATPARKGKPVFKGNENMTLVIVHQQDAAVTNKKHELLRS